MKDVFICFKKAEVANYNLDNSSFDIRVTYEKDNKQFERILHVTKDDKDTLALAENIIIGIRRMEKASHSIVFDAADPLAGFINIKIVEEDEVPERIARFITKIMNQARSSASSMSIPKYQIRESLCKMSANL